MFPHSTHWHSLLTISSSRTEFPFAQKHLNRQLLMGWLSHWPHSLLFLHEEITECSLTDASGCSVAAFASAAVILTQISIVINDRINDQHHLIRVLAHVLCRRRVSGAIHHSQHGRLVITCRTKGRARETSLLRWRGRVRDRILSRRCRSVLSPMARDRGEFAK